MSSENPSSPSTPPPPPPPLRLPAPPPAPPSPPAATTASAAPAPRKPLGRGALIGIIGGCAVVVLAIVAFAFLGSGAPKPSNTSIEGALALQLEKASLAVQNVTIKKTEDLPAGPHGETAKAVEARVTAKLKETLYEIVRDRSDLPAEIKTDSAAPEKIGKIVATPGSKRILEIAAVDPKNIPTLDGLVFVRPTAKAGDVLELEGGFLAGYTKDKGWEVGFLSLKPQNAKLDGLTRGEIEKHGKLVDMTNPAEVARIRDLIASADTTLATLEKARDQYRAELAANAQKLLDAVAAKLSEGALYTGQIKGVLKDPLDISLQVTAQNTSAKTVTVLLRTSNSWSDARTATGTLATSAETGLPTLTLASDWNPALANTGPLTGETGSLRLQLACDDATLSGKFSYGTIQLTRVPDDKREATLAALQQPGQTLRKVIATGAAFRLAATGNENIPAEEYLLLIGTVAPDGDFDATLQSTANSWTRKLRGKLDTNAHRSAGLPVKLRANNDTAVQKAASNTLLRDYSISIDLKNDGATLTGQTDNRRAITLVPATPELLASIQKQRETARTLALAIVAENATYDGTASGAAPEPVRIRFTKVTPATGNVEAVVDSLSAPGVRRMFTGKIDFDTATLTLNATSGGSSRFDTKAPAPWFRASFSSTLELSFTKETLAGKDRVSGGWTLTFPVAAGTAKATPVPYDTLPATDGAYAWTDGKWAALPKNNATFGRNALQKVNSVLGGINSVLGGKKAQPSSTDSGGTLVYDGTETPPIVENPAQMILFRGAYVVPAGAPENFPKCEIAPLETGKKNERSIAVVFVSKDLATLGQKALRFSAESIGDNLVLITPSQPLNAGRYAIVFAGRAYEFAAK